MKCCLHGTLKCHWVKDDTYSAGSFGHQGGGLRKWHMVWWNALGLKALPPSLDLNSILGHTVGGEIWLLQGVLWPLVCTVVCEHTHICCPAISFILLIGQAPCSDPLSGELTFDQAYLDLIIVLLGKYFNQCLNSCLTNVPIFTVLLYNLNLFGNSLYKISDSKSRQEYVCVLVGSQ